jgi:hypothetical protein
VSNIIEEQAIANTIEEQAIIVYATMYFQSMS